MEFNALVFCGGGSRLGPLTGSTDHSLPKALLPVGNRPMVEYVLDWCLQAPFKSITLVCDGVSETPLKAAVAKYETSRTEISVGSIKVVVCDSPTTGGCLTTCLPSDDNSNYVVLPCDFITDVPPQVLIEMYRQNSDENAGMAVVYRNQFENLDKKALKASYTVHSGGVLLDVYSKDYVALDKFLKVRTQLLWRYPSAEVSTKLMDSFVFFVSSKLRDEAAGLNMNRSISKIKRDLARSSWKHGQPGPTIGLFALPEKATFMRCNNLGVYMEANRWALNAQARQAGKPQPKDKNDATVGADCIIGQDTVLGERTSVKKSAIGAGCTVGKKCRISNCVLLEGVVLGDGVQLENCIVGPAVRMAGACKLVNCNVEGGYVVSSGVDVKGETLKALDLGEMGLQMSESEEGEDISSEGDSSSYEDYDEEEYEGEDFFSRG